MSQPTRNRKPVDPVAKLFGKLARKTDEELFLKSPDEQQSVNDIPAAGAQATAHKNLAIEREESTFIDGKGVEQKMIKFRVVEKFAGRNQPPKHKKPTPNETTTGVQACPSPFGNAKK